MRALWDKLKESLISVLPVTFIVLILNLTPLINLSTREVVIFLVCNVLLIFGIGLFNLGSDLAMSPMGEQIGASLIKSKKILVILFVCFLMGLFITIAEPDLTVLANQVKDVINPTLLIVLVGVGVGIFLVLAIIKIIFKINFNNLLIFFYMVLFAFVALLILNENLGFLALGFDSGGVTTGPITVPFIMALGIGVAKTIGGKNVNENSFGLVAMCSVGPIIAVMLIGTFSNGEIIYKLPDYAVSENFIVDLFIQLWHSCKEVFIVLVLIVAFFIIIQSIYIKLPKKKLLQIAVGIGYTFVGLVIFLTAVAIGFMPVGFKIGTQLAEVNEALVIIIGFIIGFVVVLAEPAIHVLKKQVEQSTHGGISGRSLLISLSIGVGVSIALSMIRIIFDFSILYYVIPGYILSLGISFFVPRLYTVIAFDSGGVASGPLTSSFILPLAIGVCSVLQGENKVLEDAFGIVAMVAMTPLITIQLLGFRERVDFLVRKNYRTKKMQNTTDDDQIINFM